MNFDTEPKLMRKNFSSDWIPNQIKSNINLTANNDVNTRSHLLLAWHQHNKYIGNDTKKSYNVNDNSIYH